MTVGELIKELEKYPYFKYKYDILFELIDNYFKLEKSLDKSCKELVKMCKQTNCKDCHFVKEQLDCNNDCPVRGNCTYHDWKEWCLKFEKIEQMTAKEMFEKLGYKIEHNDEDNLYYVNDDLLIQFDLIYREYCVYFKNNEIASISCEEHKAITQQLNELGWLDE